VVAHYQLGDQDLLQQHASNICQELTRYANAEIHTVASVVGGVASQEAVKIITGQYIPLDNTYVFNGIVAVGGVYRF
jgi:amyloid beta precursor protein binding protein 1